MKFTKYGAWNSFISGLALLSAFSISSCGSESGPNGPGSKKKNKEQIPTQNSESSTPVVTAPTPVVANKPILGAMSHLEAFKKCSLEHFIMYDSLHNNPTVEQKEMYHRTLCAIDAKNLANKIIDLRDSSTKGERSYLKSILPDAFAPEKTYEHLFVLVSDWKVAQNCAQGTFLNTDLFTGSSIHGKSEEADSFMKTCLATQTKTVTCRAQEVGDQIKLAVELLADASSTAIEAQTVSESNLQVPEVYKNFKLTPGQEKDLLLERNNLTANGKVTIKSGDVELCSVETPRLLRGSYKIDPLCGVETWNVARTEHCGAESYNTREDAECGVKEYKKNRTNHCGVESYTELQHPKCGYDVIRDTGHGGSTRIGEREPFVERTIMKRCRLPEFGVEKYNECRHQNHGVESYLSCALPKFGVATWKECPHEKHGPRSYNKCFIYDAR